MVALRDELDDAARARQAKAAAVAAAARLLHARHSPGCEEADEGVAGEGRSAGEPYADTCPRAGVGAVAGRPQVAGAAANTSRIVVLNCRTLEKPELSATSAIGTSLVSSRTRAVCARWARASASGPAPTASASSRWR